MSRTAGEDHRFGEVEKEVFVRVMERPLDSWEVRPGEACLTVSEWYHCWLFGEGEEVQESAYTRVGFWGMTSASDG